VILNLGAKTYILTYCNVKDRIQSIQDKNSHNEVNLKLINERLNKLYQDYYGNKYSDIVCCGVVDEEAYNNAKLKVVFILKEPNSDEGEWSIPIELNRNITNYFSRGIPLEEDFMKTWRQAGVWAYSIINGFNKYDALSEDDFVAKGLRMIGMTNLKKTGGNSISIEREIKYHAAKDKPLWTREIEIMNPDLLICGGIRKTYENVTKNLALQNNILDTIKGRDYHYSIYQVDSRQHIILDFWHPNNRENRDNVLYHLRLLMEKLRGKNLLK